MKVCAISTIWLLFLTLVQLHPLAALRAATPKPVSPSAGVCLDATFDSDGAVLKGIGVISTAALQPDGKIVVAGNSGDVFNFMSNDFVVRRFNANGSLDTTFGGGTVTTNFFGGDDRIEDIVIQPDGKIVAFGRAQFFGATTSMSDVGFALARYHSDGRLDTSFGVGGADGDGKVTTDFNTYSENGVEYISQDEGFAIALQPDGKFVAAGTTTLAYSNPDFSPDFALARYHSDGRLDTSFGVGGADGDGKVTTDFFDGPSVVYDVTFQPDGNIIAAGTAQNGTNDVAMARYSPSGTLDTSFDQDGKVTTDFGGRDAAYGVTIQPNGKIIAVGTKPREPFSAGDLALARFNPNGSLDMSFGADGKATTDFSEFDRANSVVLQPDGKLVIAGITETDTGDVPSGGGDFALVRYDPNGSLDTAFGLDGLVAIDFGGRDEASAIIIQPDGKLVVAGSSYTPGGFTFALARYADGLCPHPEDRLRVFLPLVVR